MDEINLTELSRYYLKRLPIIILVTIVALLIGYFYTKKVQVPMYHGTTTIILVQKQDDKDSSYAYQNELNINERLVTTYSQIIKSRRVLDQVIDNLKLKTKASKLAESITITAVSDTSIIKVSVSNKDNEKAVEIANEVAEVFKKEVTNIYNLENVSIVDKAIVEKTPYNISFLKQMALCGIAGITLSCAVIFVIYYFDNTIKTKKDIEDILDIPVLAEVPTVKKLTRKSKHSSNGVRASDINASAFNNIDKIDKKEPIFSTPEKKDTNNLIFNNIDKIDKKEPIFSTIEKKDTNNSIFNNIDTKNEESINSSEKGDN